MRLRQALLAATLAPLLVSATAARAEVPAAAARDPKSLLWLVTAPDGLGLFRDEALAAELGLASWAAAQGFRVVDPRLVDQAMARARAGEHLGTGQACGIPIHSFDALEETPRWFGAQGKLTSAVSCDAKGCSLEVALEDDLGFEGNVLAYFAAPFQAGVPWGPAWSAALVQLAPTKPDEGGLGGLGLGGSGARKVQAHPEKLSTSVRLARSEDDPHSSAKLDGTLQLPKGLAQLRACFGEESADAELLIELDGRGRVGRCEPREIDSATNLCACQALLASAQGRAPLRGKRALIGVSFAPADTVSAGHAVVFAHTTTYLQSYVASGGQTLWRPDVSDPSISAWQPPGDHALAACFVAERTPGRFDGRITVTFDPQGRPSDAAVEVARDASWSAAQLACVQRAFLGAGAPCPAVSGARAVAQLEIQLKTIGSR